MPISQNSIIKVSIGTFITAIIAVVSWSFAYSDSEQMQNIAIQENTSFREQGGRFTSEDGIILKSDLVHQLDRIEDKIDLILSK